MDTVLVTAGDAINYIILTNIREVEICQYFLSIISYSIRYVKFDPSHNLDLSTSLIRSYKEL